MDPDLSVIARRIKYCSLQKFDIQPQDGQRLDGPVAFGHSVPVLLSN